MHPALPVTPEAVAVSVNRVEFGEHGTLSLSERSALADRMRAQYGTPRLIGASPSSDAADQTDIPSSSLAPSQPVAEPTDHRNLPPHLEDAPQPTLEPDKDGPLPPRRAGTPKESNTEGATDWR